MPCRAVPCRAVPCRAVSLRVFTQERDQNSAHWSKSAFHRFDAVAVSEIVFDKSIDYNKIFIEDMIGYTHCCDHPDNAKM